MFDNEGNVRWQEMELMTHLQDHLQDHRVLLVLRDLQVHLDHLLDWDFLLHPAEVLLLLLVVHHPLLEVHLRLYHISVAIIAIQGWPRGR